MTTTYANVKVGDKVSTVAQPGDAFYNVTRPVYTVTAVECETLGAVTFVDVTTDGVTYAGTSDSVLDVH